MVKDYTTLNIIMVTLQVWHISILTLAFSCAARQSYLAVNITQPEDVIRQKVQPVKDKFTQKKWKCSHHQCTFMLMESQVKFCSPQNISGASQRNNVAAFS